MLTDHPARAAVAFVLALAAVAGVAYAVHQRFYSAPVLDLTPGLDVPVAAAPVAQAASGGEGSPAAAGVPVVDPDWLSRTSSATGIPVPALDGGGDFAAIAATPAGTAWHGDPVWEHAVGPMQFLPETWAGWGADGDGDGTADPRDLDDAALGAARYLCAGGRDLTSGEDWTDAVLSYNRSREYLEDVHDTAVGYAGA